MAFDTPTQPHIALDAILGASRAGIPNRYGAPKLGVDALLPTVRDVARRYRDRGESPERMVVAVKQLLAQTHDWIRLRLPEVVMRDEDRHRAVGCAIEEYYSRAD
jgi:hypothetical protein